MFLFSLGKYLWDSLLKDFETKLKMKNQKAREMSFKNVIGNDWSGQILFNSVMSHCLQSLLNEEQDTNGGKSGKEQQLLPKSVPFKVNQQLLWQKIQMTVVLTT